MTVATSCLCKQSRVRLALYPGMCQRYIPSYIGIYIPIYLVTKYSFGHTHTLSHTSRPTRKETPLFRHFTTRKKKKIQLGKISLTNNPPPSRKKWNQNKVKTKAFIEHSGRPFPSILAGTSTDILFHRYSKSASSCFWDNSISGYVKSAPVRTKRAPRIS